MTLMTSKPHRALADLCRALLQAIEEDAATQQARPQGSRVAASESGTVVQLAPAPYVTIKLASVHTGLSEVAIRHKIRLGVWIEGREWRRGPDGRLYVSMRGYQAWVERGAGK